MGGTAAMVDVVSPAPRAIWHQLVLDDADAVAEQAPQWIDVLRSRGFTDVSRLYRFDDGHEFVLPLVARGSDPRLPAVGFGTGWGMGGLVGPGLAPDHIDAVVADLATLPALYVHIRPNPLQGHIWSHATLDGARAIARRAHVVDLADGIEATRHRFRKSGRKGIARAAKAGVEVTVHTGGDMLGDYYEELFLGSIGRWAERQREPLALAAFRAKRRDPLAKLQAIAAGLGDNFRLYVGSVDGELVAGNIVLWGPNAHATRGALKYAARDTRASYALDWAAIQDACEAGHRWYQLGESGTNQTLADYKERFGAQPIGYAEYRIERLPLLAADQALRTAVKSLIGFRD